MQSILKYRNKFLIIIVILIFSFIILSIYFLSPIDVVSHDTGRNASELLIKECLYDNFIRTDYVDLSGNITLAIDKQYASVVRKIGSDGNIQKEQFLDEKGNPIKQVGGYYGISYMYDSNDRIRSITYLDKLDNVCVLDGGYAIIERTYDFNGNLLCDLYYDQQLNPVECTGGYYGIQREYKNGEYYATRYIGKMGELMNNSQGYARKTYRHDKNNNTTIEMYYNSKEESVQLNEGQYGVMYTQNEMDQITQIVYLDINGNPTTTNEGYTVLKRTYYRDGTVDTDMYYDAEGNPIALSKGQYGIKHNGQVTLLLDKNGCIMLCIDNILNGFTFMVVICGCVISLLMIVVTKKMSICLTISYTFFILYETLMFREAGSARANFVLFSYASRFFTDQTVRVGVIDNIWLFIPMGAGLYRIFEKNWVIIIPLFMSMIIEIMQYITGLGVAELDDIFGNTLGGVIGVKVVYTIMMRKNIKLKKSKGEKINV